MRILVTGGAGFIGSHLIEELLIKGHHVCALDDLSTGTMENLLIPRKSDKFNYVEGSILNKTLVESLVADSDYVIHLAAAVGVQKILKDPIGSLITNIQGSENVMFAAASRGIPTILASTSEVYGKNSSGPLNEESDRIIGSPLLSRWTYSEAKAIDESLARALYERDGYPVKIIRYFNTVGPRQSPAYGMVIPTFFRCALKGNDLVVHGDGKQSRVFCHVQDAVKGTISLFDSDKGFGDVFNIGGIEEVSILELAKLVIAMCNSSSKIIFQTYEDLRKKGFEDMSRRIPDCSKLRKSTGWQAEISLNRILEDVYHELRQES